MLKDTHRHQDVHQDEQELIYGLRLSEIMLVEIAGKTSNLQLAKHLYPIATRRSDMMRELQQVFQDLHVQPADRRVLTKQMQYRWHRILDAVAERDEEACLKALLESEQTLHEAFNQAQMRRSAPQPLRRHLEASEAQLRQDVRATERLLQCELRQASEFSSQE